VVVQRLSKASHVLSIGVVAGWGHFPIVVVQALKQQGYRVCCVGIKDHADSQLRELCDDYRELGVAKLGAAIRYFRRRGVTCATMAGKINKVLLFQRFCWLKHLPDWRTVRTFYPHFITRQKDRKDDTLLSAVVEAYGRSGIIFAPATDFAPELLVKLGTLSRRRLSRGEMQDIQFAWQIAKEIGRLDVGQSVAVKGRAVLAVEAVEGTDQCIRRAGELCPQGGFTVVKVAKPQQDMRFDVPTVGMGTLQTLREAGGRVLAVEAHKTILIDPEEVVSFANRHQLTIVAVNQHQLDDMLRKLASKKCPG
jgi:DUF1009 family protein